MKEQIPIFFGSFQVSGPSFVPEGRGKKARIVECDSTVSSMFSGDRYCHSSPGGSVLVVVDRFRSSEWNIVKKINEQWINIPILDIVSKIKLCGRKDCSECSLKRGFIENVRTFNNCVQVIIACREICLLAARMYDDSDVAIIYIPYTFKTRQKEQLLEQSCKKISCAFSLFCKLRRYQICK